MLEHLWRIELFGGLSATRDRQTITRFRTQRTGMLLAYLACHLHRTHAREALIEFLWPDGNPDAGRTSLRTALASLRRQLEPPGTLHGGILIADRTHARLNPCGVQTDVAAFQAAVEAAARSATPEEQAQTLNPAISLYRGEFLPGFYDDWVLAERERLAELFQSALEQLILCKEAAGEWGQAVDLALRAIQADPLREEAHRTVMRLYAVMGQPRAALRHLEETKRLWQEQLGQDLSAATIAFARSMQAGAADIPKINKQGYRGRHSSTLAVAPAPSLPAPFPISHLPLAFTRFFGRQPEIARVKALLGVRGTRLVTLTGIGGGGKTRLALEAATRMQDTFGESIYFAPLADRAQASQLADAVLEALPLERSGSLTPREQATQALLDQGPVLLILDNFEHLIEEGVPWLRDLLVCVPALICLVTSRRPLGIAGEQEIPIDPLPIPAEPDTPERLGECVGAALFVDRAQAVKPDFQITARNSAAIGALCRRLEGIPLAIELVAARAKTQTPARMLAHLEHRLDYLTSRRRDADPRHHSLRTALEWSHDLLPISLAHLYARLSVFRGGWTAEAVEAVCGTPARELMAQLRECSLVVRQNCGGEERFRMLEVVREHAAEKLDSKEQTALEEHHAAYFVGLAETAEPGLLGPEQARWLKRLEAEHDNMRAVLDGHGAREVEAGLRLAGAAWRFWYVRGYGTEGRERLAAALAGAPERTKERAKALNGAGALAWKQCDHADARTLFEECLDIGRQLGLRDGVASALANLANISGTQGDHDRARLLLEESLALKRESGNKSGVAGALNNLGIVATAQSDYAAAQTLLNECLLLRRELGDEGGVANALNNLGSVVCYQGDYDQARVLLEESLRLQRRLGNKGGMANAITNLGDVAREQGRHEEARALFEEGLTVQQELGDKVSAAYPLYGLGLLSMRQGDVGAARRHFQDCLRLRWEAEDKSGVAACLERLAGVWHAEGRPENACRLLGAAEALREDTRIPVPPCDRAEHRACAAAVHAALGTKTFRSLWEEGCKLGAEHAVGIALEARRV